MNVMYDHQIFSWQKYGGISRYFSELMAYYQKDPEVRFELSLLFSDNAFLIDKRWRGYSFGRYPVPKREFIYRHLNGLYSQVRLKKGNFDLFHPTYYNPYFIRDLGDKPFVLTIYDMIHEVFPTMFAPNDLTSLYKRKLAEAAERIIAISHSTRDDIVRFFDIDPSKIDVIYLANSLKARQVLDNFRLFPRYILFVGDRHLYKNFTCFVTAIAPLLKCSDSLYLICAGGRSFSPKEIILLQNLSIRQKVVWYPISDDSLYQLYSNATCFVYPSLYEGFGIPLLEAFFSGCPAVVSKVSAFTEVAGEAASYFNPLDPNSILESVKKVVEDPLQRKQFVEKGFERIKQFSWEITAEQTKEVYKSVVG